tara:strand:- start:1473 stop:1901 length:429 start_codon:yes stop_codon:yes gene_type:complete
MNWRDKLDMDIKQRVEEMLYTYDGLIDITSKIQEKNGTIMFQLSGERFGVYKSGMVRKYFQTRFGQWSCYQLNRTRKSTNYHEILSSVTNELKVMKSEGMVRVSIYGQLARLKYLEQFLVKNRGLTPNNVIVVDGIRYKKMK